MTDENLTPMPEEPAAPPAPPVPEPVSAPDDFAPAVPAAEPYVPPMPEPAAPPAYAPPAPEPPAPPAYAPPTPPAPPAPPQPGYAPPQPGYTTPVAGSEKQKIVAGILAILLGALGVHKFYLGYQKEGIIMLAVTLVGSILLGLGPAIAGLIGLVEGVIYLTKTDAEFEATYVTGRKAWF